MLRPETGPGTLDLMKAFLMFLMMTAMASVSVAQNEGIFVKPKYSVTCILTALAPRMKVRLQPEIPLPEVLFESEVDLKNYQDDVEPQWGFRPDALVNVYVLAKNRIYLSDGAESYAPQGRFIDDSLAHELVHYLQVKYKKMNPDNEMAEIDAIFHQNWFRDTFMTPGLSPCP